jgi:hypothetical protein
METTDVIRHLCSHALSNAFLQQHKRSNKTQRKQRAHNIKRFFDPLDVGNLQALNPLIKSNEKDGDRILLLAAPQTITRL